VGVAAVVERANGSLGGARIGLTNMGQTPLRASAAEAALEGAPPDGIAAAADHADAGTDPPDDTFASSDFRRHLSHVLTRRAVEEAIGRG
jgi:aerobic carbon-monoxide dehydrogenase medium subunit